MISTMENFPSLDEKSRNINDGSLQKQHTQLRKATSVLGKHPALCTQALQLPNPHCKDKVMQLHSFHDTCSTLHGHMLSDPTSLCFHKLLAWCFWDLCPSGQNLKNKIGTYPIFASIFWLFFLSRSYYLALRLGPKSFWMYSTTR